MRLSEKRGTSPIPTIAYEPTTLPMARDDISVQWYLNGNLVRWEASVVFSCPYHQPPVIGTGILFHNPFKNYGLETWDVEFLFQMYG